MPSSTETPTNPPRITNPYTATHQSHPHLPISNNTDPPQNTTQQNLTSWLLTARNNPTASPNFWPTSCTTTQNQAQQNHCRNNRIPWQTITETPQTPLDQPTASPLTTQNNQQTLPQFNGIQMPISPPQDNKHWGNLPYPLPPAPSKSYQRTNSLPTTDNFVHWRAAVAASQATYTSVMCFQETNLRWDNNNYTKVAQIMWQSHNAIKISISSSNEPSAPEYQPRGMITATLGLWTSWVKHTASHSTGLSRWSYIMLWLKDDCQLQILSGYRVCEQNPTIRSWTCYNQQLRLLTAAGHHNPNPWKQFVSNLTQLIKTGETKTAKSLSA